MYRKNKLYLRSRLVSANIFVEKLLKRKFYCEMSFILVLTDSSRRQIKDYKSYEKVFESLCWAPPYITAL